uniref:CCHC-type domain-containing protein n=1 Tax=Tanacetum cinerariifolium TaxID=118510 RepID=A0A6L2NS21_TANCI|nr:hypothetical protein [Tanacetum cinerariifolium]
MLPVAPPSPDYILGLEEPQTPPAPQDEDEHEPMFIQPHDPNFVPEPIYPEYVPLEDEHILLAEEQPLPHVVSPTVESPGYVAESDPEEDLEEDDADDEDEDEEDEEEEEHLAPADSVVVIPTDELAAKSFPPEAEVERLLAMPTPSPSPLTSLSRPSARERLARCTAPTALPSPPLPPPLPMPPPVDRIRSERVLLLGQPEAKGIDYGFVTTLDAEARRQGIGEVGYGIKDTWIDTVETVLEMAPMTVGERVDLRIEDMIAYQETIQIVEDEAYAAREAWAHSIGLSQAVYFELQTHQEQESGIDGRDSPSDGRHETRDGRHADRVVSTAQIMVPVRRQGPSTLPNNTNLNNMTPESGEIKKLEIELWNLKVKVNNVLAYTERFHELTLIYTKFVVDENEKIDKYVSGLPDNIYESMKASNLNTRKADESFRNNHGHQQQTLKRQNVTRVYNMGTSEMKPYSGNLPKCTKCHFHHNGPCTQKCHKCNKVGHFACDCENSGNANIANAQRNTRENPKGNGCFECRATGHFKRDCPKLKNRDGEKVNALGWVYADGNVENRGNALRDPDSNVVTGTFLLNNRYASILFDIGADRSFISTTFSSLIDIILTLLENSYDVELADGKIVGVDTIMRGRTLNFLGHPFNIDLIPIELGSFDVISGMDWLRRCHVVIVCDEKLVRIPYGNETLTFHGNESNNGRESRLTVISCSKAQEYLPNGCQIFLAQIFAKKEEDKSEGKQLEDVPVVWDYPEIFLAQIFAKKEEDKSEGKHLEDVPVVWDYPEVFPKDLPGLPQARPVEFQIDLIPGAAP